MIGKDDIIIRKAILHILDTTHAKCTLSDILLNPGEDLYDFIRNHIYKIVSSDDTKECEFDPEFSTIYPLLQAMKEEDAEAFIHTSKELAERLYTAMGEGLDIPAADLLCVSFQAEGVIYLALLKLNYRDSYTHKIAVSSAVASDMDSPSASISDTDSSENVQEALVQAGIVKTHALLPTSSTRLPEAIVINLSNYHIQLLEKKYEVNGEKVNYLSERYLMCHTQLPSKKKLHIITKVINDISNKFDGADLKVKMDTKSSLQKSYVDQQSFDVEEIGTKLFGNHPAKKAAFDEKMEQYNLQYDNFSVVNETTVKKLEKQVMVTDNGIEISIPMEVYNKLASFEVQTDVTGKSTIIIRDIDNLILK